MVIEGEILLETVSGLARRGIIMQTVVTIIVLNFFARVISFVDATLEVLVKRRGL